MNIRVVMALNMYDELTAEGAEVDYAYLGQLLGMPVVPTRRLGASGVNGGAG